MKAFTTRFMCSIIGITLICFIIVYALFNFAMSSHISAEAKRDLSNTVATVEAWSDLTHETGMPIYVDVIIPYNYDEYEMQSLQDAVVYLPYSLPQINIRPISQARVSADIIMVDGYGTLMFPYMYWMAPEEQTVVMSLTYFHNQNRERFESGNMVRVQVDDETFYMLQVGAQVLGMSVVYLLYTNVTSSVALQSTMNLVLLLLLAGIALAMITVSFMMSNKFKTAIGRLCHYAEAVGDGKFDERESSFSYLEFNNLQTSMNKMTGMLREYDNSQKLFYQNVSHELKAPLMSMQGYAEGILEGIFDKDTAAQVILSRGDKMKKLVDDLLFISKMESGVETEGLMFATDINNVIYDCCESLRSIAEKSGKRMAIDIPDEDVHVVTDDAMLETVISNILSNAIRHAKSEVKISRDFVDSMLAIRIQDDGPGIASVDMPHIFDRFYKGKNGNVGLGLAICKEIMKRLGGDIAAENLSHPESGARFTILLER